MILFKKYIGFFILCLVTSTIFSQQYRYIRVQKSGTNTTNYINLAEIQVIDIDGVTNRSLAGTATLSTTYPGGDASKGNDNNTNGNWSAGSILHSNGTNTNDWWEIDLGALYTLSHINIYNRTDCCSDRLSNMYVMASDTPFNTSGNNTANLTAALANSDFTYQFGAITNSTMQVVTFPTYCTSYGNTTYDTGITLVSFNSINNATGPSKLNGYEDFTGLSTNVILGSSHNLTVNVNTDGNYWVRVYAWIDWNQDGIFTNSERYDLGRVRNVTNGATNNSPLSITIPNTAMLGVTRMRVSAKYDSYAGSCETNFDGEVEDYSINVTPVTPTITTGSISTTTYCSGSSVNVPFTISGTYNSGNVFTAQLSNASGSFTSPVNIGTLTSIAAGTISGTITIGTLTGTGYRVRVISNNPSIIGTNNGVNITINSTPTAPVIGTITQPTCTVATGSVVLNSLPSGNWLLTRTPGNIITPGNGASTTISGLVPNTYNYTVNNLVAGLTGQYFNNMTFTGSPALVRTDATVNFNWGTGNPGSPINNNNFSVRWSGFIQPLYTETYTFRTNSDDGIRLWVNGVQIINNWTDHGPTINTGTINLTADVKYTIVLEFYENGGGAVAELSWSSPSQAQQIIPSSQLFSSGSCTSPISANVVINGAPTSTTWTGSTNNNWNTATNWSCGTVPTMSTDVIIPSSLASGNYPIIYSGDPYGKANNIEIQNNSATTLEIRDNYIQIAGTLLLNGVMDLVGEGQLLQTATSTVDDASTGYIERDQQGQGNKYRYNDWSSPVIKTGTTNGTAFKVPDVLRDGTDPSNPITIDFVGGYDGALGTPIKIAHYWMYKYANSTSGDYNAWQQIRNTGTLKPGEGFLMKGTGAPGSPDQNYVFVGKPNNGIIGLTVAGNYDYLVGNPYPSAIDGFQFLLDNSPSGTGAIGGGGAIYFWEHYGGNSHNLRDYQAGYATLTLSGGVPATAGALAGVSSSGTPVKTPGRYIPIGQSFFVVGDADGGTIEFNNGQRVFVTETNATYSIFMKGVAQKTTKESNVLVSDTRPKFRLGFSGAKIDHRQILFTVDEHTTDGVDWGYEAEIYELFEDDMFWTIDDKKYVIQASNSVDINKEIPLGITSSGGSIAINMDALENVDDSTDLFIKDSLTGVLHPIKSQSFEIDLPKGTYLNRFSFVFKTPIALEPEEPAEEILSDGIQVFMDNSIKELQIRKSTAEEIETVILYNSLGQMSGYWKKDFSGDSFSLPVKAASGIYFVQIDTKSGKISKKVLVE
ncbi:PA14 domain-containing protein [Lutibacter sp.]|uniref:PA14 domain-containing protein n=1 Tax=Lutibacter sp. TaxID=1925666 RepID=UPI001A272D4A|nr:PA14 domain-containing protein [Lutibacter sp.]MBI9040830.1 T9SS type A sorting domain-containing protein [Lutibacter sp.]